MPKLNPLENFLMCTSTKAYTEVALSYAALRHLYCNDFIIHEKQSLQRLGTFDTQADL
jgi:hypothetical protein